MEVARTTLIAPEGPSDASVPGRDLPTHRTLFIGLALFAVYVIWGSTYLVMRIALDTLPPFLMSGLRFAIAGGLLMAFLWSRGAALPSPKQWAASALVGTLLLVLGNALVAVAERSIGTGVAATIVATMPLWMTGIGAFWGERVSRIELLGLALGFAGVAVLNRTGDLSFHSVDALALVIAPVAWALGSVWSRRLPLPPKLMATAAEMLCGGAILLCLAWLRGDRPSAPLTAASVGALAYLITMGSLVAFSAFNYLLRTVRPTLASSYAYVNPIIALGLATWLNHEPLTGHKLIACGLTALGLVLSMTFRARQATVRS
jgi:drug/metabolite transporter (DMT)-like permease